MAESPAPPIRVEVTRLDADAVLPRRAHSDDAGLDLHAARACSIEPGARALVETGIALAIPPGWAGFVLPRSGLALQHGLTVLNAPGLIDAGYRGEIKVLLVNLGAHTASLGRGDRIAQLVFQPVPAVDMVEVQALPPSERGPRGFGSTGH